MLRKKKNSKSLILNLYNMNDGRFNFICLTSFLTGEGNGTPLQYFCLENPMDGGAWWAAVHGVAKSQTRLSDFTFTFHFPALEKAMASHSSSFAWKTPWTGEPGGPQSMKSLREGNGNPLQCSCLENPRDGGAWCVAVHGVAQSRTRLKRLSSSSSSSWLLIVWKWTPTLWTSNILIC